MKVRINARIKARNAERLSIGELARSPAVHIETIRFASAADFFVGGD